MIIVNAGKLFIMKLIDHLRILFIPYIAHALVKEESENVFFIITAIYLPSQNIRALP